MNFIYLTFPCLKIPIKFDFCTFVPVFLKYCENVPKVNYHSNYVYYKAHCLQTTMTDNIRQLVYLYLPINSKTK